MLHGRLLLFLSNLLTLLLVCKDLLLVLLETDEVEVQILNSILFEQVLTNQARQVNACLRQSAVLVQRRVSLNGREVASIVAHVERLFVTAQ